MPATIRHSRPQSPKNTRNPFSRTTRPPYARMMRIHQMIEGGAFPNCSGLADEFEVSYKTVQRDIDFMRDQMMLPIDYDAVRHGFWYTKPVSAFPTVNISEGEVVALLVAQKALEQYRGTTFEKPLRQAFEKVRDSLGEESSFSMQDLAGAFSFRSTGTTEPEMKVFRDLAAAVLERREVEFDYHSLRGVKSERRRVAPYHMGCIENQWYLIGLDQVRNKLRTFALTRLSRPKVLKTKFRKPADFSMEKMMGASFSAFESQKPERVVVRLDAFAARLASERMWHPSQTLHPLEQGGAELRLTVGLAPDLEKWILGWGAHAEVLEPPRLRESIAATARSMALQYS